VWWFGFKLPSFWVILPFLIGIFGCALILGIIVNILILSFGQKVEITAWMFAHIFLILCGIYYPIDVLPDLFQKIALVVPITHFLEYFRQFYGFKSHFNNSLIIGYGLTVVYLILALMLLKQAYIRARQKGVVVRLSE
jgi:ABC-2 type transport system permease protein